jgi:hypothetical protein
MAAIMLKWQRLPVPPPQEYHHHHGGSSAAGKRRAEWWYGSVPPSTTTNQAVPSERPATILGKKVVPTKLCKYKQCSS